MYRFLDKLGGYLPPGVLGPIDLTTLISRLLLVDGAPLFNVRLIKDPTSAKRSSVSVLLEPPEGLRAEIPTIDELLSGFLPSGMSSSQRTKEAQTIVTFITMLEKIYSGVVESATTTVSSPVG